MRNYIRHPSDIPIEIVPDRVLPSGRERLNDIGYGGLSFTSNKALQVGAHITFRLPLITPAFEVQGRVAWCRGSKGEYDIGIEFLDKQDVYRVRMVEQVCHIQHYKEEMLATEGRDLTGHEAALEWIRKYASHFPTLEEDNETARDGRSEASVLPFRNSR